MDAYNDAMRAENDKTTYRVYTINAIDGFREIATYGNITPCNVAPKDVNNCGGLISTVKLTSKSWVMLMRNIFVSDELVNEWTFSSH